MSTLQTPTEQKNNSANQKTTPKLPTGYVAPINRVKIQEKISTTIPDSKHPISDFISTKTKDFNFRSCLTDPSSVIPGYKPKNVHVEPTKVEGNQGSWYPGFDRDNNAKSTAHKIAKNVIGTTKQSVSNPFSRANNVEKLVSPIKVKPNPFANPVVNNLTVPILSEMDRHIDEPVVEPVTKPKITLEPLAKPVLTQEQIRILQGDRKVKIKKNLTALESFAKGRPYPDHGLDSVYLVEHFDSDMYHGVCAQLIKDAKHNRDDHYLTAAAVASVAFAPLAEFDYYRVFIRYDVGTAYWLNYETSEWICVHNDKVKNYAFTEYIKYLNTIKILYWEDKKAACKKEDKEKCQRKINVITKHISSVNNSSKRNSIWTAMQELLKREHSRKPKLIRTNDVKSIMKYNVFPKALVTPDPKYRDAVSGELHPKVQKFKDHVLDVLCEGEIRAYKATISIYRKIMVDMVRSNKLLIHKGIQGSGKSSVLVFIRTCILGPNLVWRGDHFGQLLQEKNYYLEDKLIWWIDDADNPDSIRSFRDTDWGRLKSMTSADDVMIKKLFVDAYPSPNNATIIALVNDHNPIPSSADKGKRRDVYTQVSGIKVGNTAEWDFWYDQKDGMMNLETGALVLGWLASEECLAECIDLNEDIDTDLKTEVMECAKTPIELFHRDVFVDKEYPIDINSIHIDRSTYQVFLSKPRFMEDYKQWHKESFGGYDIKPNVNTFGRDLNNVDNKEYININSDCKSVPKRSFPGSTGRHNCYTLIGDYLDIKVIYSINNNTVIETLGNLIRKTVGTK